MLEAGCPDVPLKSWVMCVPIWWLILWMCRPVMAFVHPLAAFRQCHLGRARVDWMNRTTARFQEMITQSGAMVAH